MIKQLLLSITALTFTTLLFSQNYDIYVSDAGNYGPGSKILKFDPDGQNPVLFTDENIDWPQDILFLEEENVVLISNLNTNVITKHDSNSGDYIENFATVSGGPTRMEIGPDGSIYVLQWGGDGLVLRYDTNGTLLGAFTSVGVTQSIGIEWDDDNSIYVSSYGGGTVRKFDASGQDLGLFITSELTGPTNIKTDSNGDFLVLDWTDGNIERFDSQGNHLDTFITNISQAEGIAFYNDGNFLIGHGADGSVKHYDTNGNLLQEIIESGSGGLIRPNAVILRDPELSVNEFKISSNFIFNNSIGKEFYINQNIKSKIKRLIIYDIKGQKIKEIPSINNKLHLNLSSGVYMINAITNQGILTQKIVITQ